MAVGVRQFARLLNATLNVLYPNLKAAIYVSRRKEYIHLGLDFEFFTFSEYENIIETIKSFKVQGYDINETHKFVFPTRVLSTRWKRDYIIFKKKK